MRHMHNLLRLYRPWHVVSPDSSGFVVVLLTCCVHVRPAKVTQFLSFTRARECRDSVATRSTHKHQHVGSNPQSTPHGSVVTPTKHHALHHSNAERAKGSHHRTARRCSRHDLGLYSARRPGRSTLLAVVAFRRTFVCRTTSHHHQCSPQERGMGLIPTTPCSDTCWSQCRRSLGGPSRIRRNRCARRTCRGWSSNEFDAREAY
jgi:hypothetical protein